MNQINEALEDIQLIKRTVQKSQSDISDFHLIFLVLGIGNIIYYLCSFLIFKMIGINGHIMMWLSLFNRAYYISALVLFFCILKKQANVYKRKIFLLLGTGLFFIPILFFLIQILMNFFDATRISDTALLLIEQRGTINVILFCGILLLIGFEKDLSKFLPISVFIIISYIIIGVLNGDILHWDIVLKTNLNDSNMTIPIKSMFELLINTIGYLFLGLYLKKGKELKQSERI